MSGHLKTNRLAIAALAALAVALPGSFAASQEIAFEHYTLPNGLTVILHEDHRLPRVAVNLWYYVGSKDEPKGRSGFAHLFEHLMFMGTKKVPTGQFDTIMEGAGGSNNATTSSDRTNYFESGPRELLELFLFLEADRMTGLSRAMTLEKLNTQRGVVRNERRQSYENRPYGQLWLEIPALIFPREHPYHHPVIGSHADLESAAVSDVVGFFNRFYFPANASLAIAGDFEPEEAKALVAKYFGSIPGKPAISRKKPAPPRIEGILRKTLTDAVELPLACFVWHSPPFYVEGDADMDILANALAGGKSSRLYRHLVYDRKLAQNVSAWQSSSLLGSEFIIQVFALPGAGSKENLVRLGAIEKEVDAVIAELREKGATAREIARARNSMESSFWADLESLEEKADLLNRYLFHFGRPGAIDRDLARYSKITPATTSAWAKRVLDPQARLILHVLPREKEAKQ